VTGNEVATLREHIRKDSTDQIYALTFTPNGNGLSSASPGEIRISRAPSWKEIEAGDRAQEGAEREAPALNKDNLLKESWLRESRPNR
jgi:hypothetical protein